MIVLTTLVLIALFVPAGYIIFRSKKASEIHEKSKNTGLYVKDMIIMSSMTLIYLIITLINLGSLDVPNTSWKPARAGESFTIDLSGERSISMISYYCGSGEGSYNIEYMDEKGDYLPIAVLQKSQYFKYYYKCTYVYGMEPVKTKQLRFTVFEPGGIMNEIGIFENGSQKPLTGIKIISPNIDPSDTGTPGNLFDEQQKIGYAPPFIKGTYFDEFYYVRAAKEYLSGLTPYEITHPPLGKLIIALGIYLFGMAPFGWRILGVLSGAAMIPLMYLFGKKIFKDRFCSFCTALLMMFDFMHFTQTRVATIDVFAVFFIILSYYFFFDYYTVKSYNLGLKKSLKPLFFSGVFLGMGIACKWIAVFSAAGIALLLAITKYGEYKDFLNKKTKKAPWAKDFMPLYMNKTLIYCILFFIVIPGVIYLLSYIPYMAVPGNGLKAALDNQSVMLGFHASLESTVSYPSRWWSWPLMLTPFKYSSHEYLLSAGKVSSIVSMGNPAIWWSGIAAVAAAIIIAVKKRDRGIAVVLTAFAFQYLPWTSITRPTFIYHFFSSVPFVIFAIVYVIKYMKEKYPVSRYVVYSYLALVVLLFAAFYPVLSGMEVNRSYVDNYLTWFKDNWIYYKQVR